MSRLDLWPTYLNINRDHLFIKDHLPTKCEASGAKRSWVFSCTRCGRPTWPLTFDLLTRISTGIIYSSRTIYLPSLKLVWQSILELSVAQGVGAWHGLWPWPTDLNINSDHLLIKYYIPTKFEASGTKHFWVISCTMCGRLTWTFVLDFWPTDLNISRDHLLINEYSPTKFEASGEKRCWVIGCARTMDTDIPTGRHMCKAICPSFFKRGGGGHNKLNTEYDWLKFTCTKPVP